MSTVQEHPTLIGEFADFLTTLRKTDVSSLAAIRRFCSERIVTKFNQIP